jgi:hypothetical protein
MPLARISLRAGKADTFRRALGNAAHVALMEEANVSHRDAR